MAEPLSSISGLSSGIDYKTLVDQIMSLERRPADRLQKTIDANTKKKEALDNFRKLVTDLRTAAEAFKTGSGLDAYSTTAGGTDSNGKGLVVATASAGATPATYQVEVTSLTRAQKTIGTAQTSSTAALNLTGLIDLNVNGASIGQLNLDGTESLETIRDEINAIGGGTKVRATILSAGTTDQRLVLSGLQQGAAGAFSFTDADGTGAAAITALGLDNAAYETAADASFKIDGVPMTRSSNTVSDAIPNVTLTLNAAEAGKTATVTVERYQSAAVDAAKAFVDAYNKVAEFLSLQNGPDVKGVSPPLRGDGTLRSMRSSLSGAMLGSAAGALPLDLQTFGGAGISLGKDGKLTLDAEKFKTAFDARGTDLKALLADRGTAVFDIADGMTLSGSGTLDLRTTGLTDANAALTGRIADIDARLEKKRMSLLAQYAKFEASLGRLKAIGDSLGAQLNGLTASKDS
jgi:flagellar hook-associated protein 2